MHYINPESLLRLRQIIGDPKADPPIPALVNVSKSTWWSWTSARIVAAPVRIGGATFWRAADVLRLIDRAAHEEPARAPETIDSGAAGIEDWKQKLRARSAGSQP
jgi:prophage regulatory protein